VERAVARHAAIALCEHARADNRMAALRLLGSRAYWRTASIAQAIYHALLILSPDLAKSIAGHLRLGR
jgi:hypothetical protein